MSRKKKQSQALVESPGKRPQVGDDFRETILREVKPPYRDRYQSIVAQIEKVCLGHCEPLDHEYLATSMLLAATCCQKGTPVVEGRAKAESWAAGILWTVGMINFLDDKSSEPHLSSAAAAKAFGVSQATLQAKCREVREGLDIRSLDPRYTLPSMLIHNPLIWMLETEEGFVVDARDLPMEVQQAAFEEGLIPFVVDPDRKFGTGLTVLPRDAFDGEAESQLGGDDAEEDLDDAGWDAGVFRIFD